MRLDTAPRFSARDLSYAIAVIHLGMHGQPDDPESHIYRIPDNRLRASLGLTRRDNAEVEDSRFIRLRDSSVKIEDGPSMPLPTTTFRLRSGEMMPNRNVLDDEVSWTIDPGLIDAFRPKVGDTVHIPLDLIRGAQNRYGLEFALKVLAMHAMGADQPGTMKWTDDSLVRKVKVTQIFEVFGIGKMPASVFEDRYLQTATRDGFDAAGISIDVEMRRGSTRANPVGKLKELIIYMHKPAPSRILEALAAEERSTGWQKPPRSKKPVEAPVASNVVAFSAKRAALPRIGIPSMRAYQPSKGKPDTDQDAFEF